mgnify:CR=1 FL=1
MPKSWKRKITVRQEVPHKNKTIVLSYKMAVPTGNSVDNEIKRPSRKNSNEKAVRQNIWDVRLLT